MNKRSLIGFLMGIALSISLMGLASITSAEDVSEFTCPENSYLSDADAGTCSCLDGYVVDMQGVACVLPEDVCDSTLGEHSAVDTDGLCGCEDGYYNDFTGGNGCVDVESACLSNYSENSHWVPTGAGQTGLQCECDAGYEWLPWLRYNADTSYSCLPDLTVFTGESGVVINECGSGYEENFYSQWNDLQNVYVCEATTEYADYVPDGSSVTTTTTTDTTDTTTTTTTDTAVPESINFTQTINFPDVPSSHVYVQAIEFVASEGIVSGNPDGTYAPDATINRAAFTKIVMEAVTEGDIADHTGAQCFPDVESGAWYEKYVCLAKTQGVIAGYPDGTFQATNNVNLAEAAKIVYGAFGISTTETEVWYERYLNHARAFSYIPDFWTADHELTRGEMAYFIARVMGGDVAEVDYDSSYVGSTTSSQSSSDNDTTTTEDTTSLDISEVMYDPTDSWWDGNEYVVISNEGDVTVDLAGWYLESWNGDRFTFGTYELAPGESVTVYTYDETFLDDNEFSFESDDPIWGIIDEDTLNYTEHVYLYEPDGGLHDDEVIWESID